MFFIYLCKGKIGIMKFISFSIKDISDYRTELMGWAILWIMMLHFTFTQIKPLGFIAQYRFACVEIFPFVSGFELFNSLDKADSILFSIERDYRASLRPTTSFWGSVLVYSYLENTYSHFFSVYQPLFCKQKACIGHVIFHIFKQ